MQDATDLKIQVPVINPLVNSESMIEKDITVNGDMIKGDELATYASHFKYISTMLSFNDSFFQKYY